MAADVYRLTVFGSVVGQHVENVFHWRSGTTGAPNPGLTAKALLDGWRASIEALYLNTLPANYLLTGYQCRRVNNGGGNTSTIAGGWVPGNRSGNAEMSLAGPQIHWPFTDLAGYYGTGKTFLPAMSVSDIDEGRLDPAFITDIMTWVTEMLETITDGMNSFDLVIFSPKMDAAYLPLNGGLAWKIGYLGRRLKPIN